MGEIEFVKMHAGWDEIVFLYGDQIENGEELAIALSLLDRPSIRGTEAGILYEAEKDGDIKVRIADITSKDFIGMCGGLAQSLGKAVIESDIGERFGISIQAPKTQFVLETDVGLVPITVDVVCGKAGKVTTNMRSYVEECYRYGIRDVCVGNVNAVSVGVDAKRMEFLVVSVDELRNNYRTVDFWSKSKMSLHALNEVYETFMLQEGLEGHCLYGAVYDMHPEGSGDARIAFRFLPTMYAEERGFEMACGTGTVAVGIAMLKQGDLPARDGTVEVVFELGSRRIVEERYQAETELRAHIQDGKVIDAEFSHGLIEMVAFGKVHPTSSH